MTNPVVGPVTSEISTSTRFQRRERYRQKRPFDKALPYLLRESQVLRNLNSSPDPLVGAYDWFSVEDHSLSWNPLIQKAYDRLKAEVGPESAMWAVNFLEYKKSLSMATERAISFYQAFRALRRWDLPQVFDKLTISPSRGRKAVSRRKSLANNWLELHFGWVPLVQDIGNTIDILQQPVKSRNIKGSASGSGVYDLTIPSEGQNPNAWHPNFLTWRSYDHLIYRQKVKMGARVVVTNPNLLLANQLGFVNPMQVIWESIPFSFVLDWFTNVGSFLSQGTDFLGLDLENPWTTRFFQAIDDSWYSTTYRWLESGVTMYGGQTKAHNISIVQLSRTQGITLPSLYVKPMKMWGWERMATAISLVVQQLRKA